MKRAGVKYLQMTSKFSPVGFSCVELILYYFDISDTIYTVNISANKVCKLLAKLNEQTVKMNIKRSNEIVRLQ